MPDSAPGRVPCRMRSDCHPIRRVTVVIVIQKPHGALARTGHQEERPIMNPNKDLWKKGDFTRIAESMRASGEDAIHTLGEDTLDVGAGWPDRRS